MGYFFDTLPHPKPLPSRGIETLEREGGFKFLQNPNRTLPGWIMVSRFKHLDRTNCYLTLTP